ncbi:uncharacterized protein LOC118271236 [Spodoptera frugiperda]|uniref:Uncharacterized protein LOC118271236 n=1 Tax=Spodoptera frugiperda TaxID=7108 RepID=A0A9R0D7A6_SPOFR|nr:uncharacterized protein LOC118271236 [Spodoptera frugiperda]
MFKTCVILGLACVLLQVAADDDFGPGTWKVHFIEKCDQHNHKFIFDIKQKKINRTHDGFNGNLILDEDFDEFFGVRIDICKHVDGGCKQYQVLSDDCFINFVNKYAEENAKVALTFAGVVPPEFPVHSGNYELNDYIFDYSELPSDGWYGYFCAKAFVLQGSEEVGCVEIHVEFIKIEEDEDD